MQLNIYKREQESSRELTHHTPSRELTHHVFYLPGAHVYLACRSVDKAENAAKHIQERTGIQARNSPIIQLDLSSLKSVKNFVYEFKRRK